MFIAVRLFWNGAVETLYWLIISTVIGAEVYAIMVWLFKVKEFRFMVGVCKKGMKKVFSRTKR